MENENEILEAIRNIKEKCPHRYIDLAQKYMQLSLFYLDKQQLDKAYDAAKNYTFYAFVDDDPFVGYSIYSFRAITDYSLADISEGKLSLVAPELFNDPFDTVIKNWIEYKIDKEPNCVKKEFYYFLTKTIRFIKSRCFVSAKKDDGTKLDIEEISPLMWAHYADSHKGFCAEYEVPDGFVTNNNQNCSFTRIGKIKYGDIDSNLNQLSFCDSLLRKGSVWSYEKEIRVVNLDYTINKDFKVIKAPKLNAVYLGLKCSSEDEHKLKQVLNSGEYKHTKLYRMEIDDNNFLKIKTKRIW